MHPNSFKAQHSPKTPLLPFLVAVCALIALYLIWQVGFGGSASETQADWRPRREFYNAMAVSIKQRLSPSPSPLTSPPSPRRIALIVVVLRLADLKSYADATATMRCYAGIAGYPLYCLHMDTSDAGSEGVGVNGWNATRAIAYCKASWPQKPDYDALMFFRHCLVAEFLYEHEGVYDWVLTLDADIGVVNPQHRLEEWIDESDSDVDIVFYTRCISHEWMAGSYLARNTPGTRRFLAEWVAEGVAMSICPGKELVNHDQSAIQEAFMRLYATMDERKKCRDYYLDTHYFPNNNFHSYIACTQHFLGPRATNRTTDGVSYFGGGSLPRVKTLPRFYPAWVRDGESPVTSKWAPSDFMFHEWKNVLRRPTPNQPNPSFDKHFPFAWDTPFNESFATNIDFNECVPERREEIVERYWRQRYVPELVLANTSQLRPYFQTVIDETDADYARRLAKLPNKGNFSA